VFHDHDRLAEIAALDRARLEEVPFALLLLAHEAAGTSGMLVARRGKVEKRVLLSAGAPLDCRSNLVHETLSRFLVSVGRLTAQEEPALLSRSIAEGKLFGRILIEDGRLDEADLHRLLQQNLARKLFDLFTWRDGDVAVERGEIGAPTDLRVRVPQLVLTGVTRFMPREGLERAIEPLTGAPLARGELLTSERDTLRLSNRERAVLAALDRPRRFEELLVLGAGKPAEMARSILALSMLGGIVPASEAPEQPPPPAPLPAREVPAPAQVEPEAEAVPPAEPSSVASAASEPGGAIEARAPDARPALSLDAVRAAYATFRNQDPFDLLGVGEIATAREAERRFLDFCRRFAPWPWTAAGQHDVAERVGEIFVAGALAFARLRDPDAFESLLRERRERRAAAEPPGAGHSFRIETDLLDADVQFKKGLALKQAGKLDLAQPQLDFAADCDAQNGLYLAEAAHCRFLLAPSIQAEKTLEELNDAQRIDPSCGEAYLYAGEIALHLGRLDVAEGNLRQAARRLGARDPRPQGMLGELNKRRRKKSR